MVGPELSRRLPYYKELKVTFSQAFFGVIFLGGSVAHNYFGKRPLSASLLKHVALASVGIILGTEVDKLVEARRNAKVLVIEDYISKHPEDFPITTPKKYKDILLPWGPLR